MKAMRIGSGPIEAWSKQLGGPKANTSGLSVPLCGWMGKHPGLCLFFPRLNCKNWWQYWLPQLVDKGSLSSSRWTALHHSLIVALKISLTTFVAVQKLIPSTMGQACFLELSSDEPSPAHLDETQHCSHCNTSLNLLNTQSLIVHSSVHILNDGTIWDNDELCGLCLHPSTHCIFRAVHRSSDAYQLDLLQSTCTLIVKTLSKQTFNYSISAGPMLHISIFLTSQYIHVNQLVSSTTTCAKLSSMEVLVLARILETTGL